ncbi:uncharacterized protein LOC110838941 isoform X2 [Zootermopsis nevadensis]|uniref:Vitellogenin n=1 Tax=Zootermopsis nevadensis TaxID=136037 RepID=A0A067QLY6_ZOONE|nr:uncharacterized protein LOC110838941 isoform X2 [Zootermopsis nevadensis]KDR09150.1 Vitellogenin [Zootermopsis nevadensis]
MDACSTLQLSHRMEQMARAVLLLPLVVSTVASLELWLPGREVVYRYETSLEAGTIFPVATVSQWNMTGKLVVQGAGHMAVVQLQDLKVSMYNGPRIHDTQVVETPLPEQASQLLQQFIIHYDAGQIIGLSVKAGEDEWAINMKRGLASLLQLDLSHLQSAAFISAENSHYGHCDVEYSVQRQSNEMLAVRKFVNFSSCMDFPVKKFGYVQKVCPSGAAQETVSSGSVRAYVLEPSGPAGHLVIHSIQADGVTHLQHFGVQSDSYVLWSWVGLYLQQQGDMVVPLTMKGGGQRVGLTHQVPGADMSQGRSHPSQEDLLITVAKILGDLADSLEWRHLETDRGMLHEEHVVHALHLLSLLNQASLQKLYSELEFGTSYQHETLRNLFLEMLPLVGSRDSILLVRDLMVRRTFQNDTAVQLLSSLPFSVREPSEQLLTDLEVLLLLPEGTLEHQAAVLSFATLVNKVCSVRCAQETLDKYVGRYLDLFTGSSDHASQMLYLVALGNFEIRRVLQFLAPIIRGDDTEYSLHIRILAAWATMGQAALQPDQVYHLYWPLLTNRSEYLEVRVAAFTMLVLSRPTLARFHNLMLILRQEQNPHLRHFWYTTLHSLAHTHCPCYSHLREVARNVARFIAEPKVRRWATGNYILDYRDPDHGFGSLAHLIIVANPRTGLPASFFLDFSSHAMDFSYNQFSIYVRLDGLGDAMKRQLMHAGSVNVTQLIHLLQQLEVPVNPSEPVHVELLVRLHNKAVLVHHANQSTLSTLFRVLNTVQLLASGGVHLNAQNIIVPLLVEETRATDLGTNAILKVSSGWLVSVRANFTVNPVHSSGLHVRSLLNSRTALMQYNPVMNVWHGVEQSVSIQVNVPFSLKASFNTTQQSIRFTVRQTPGEELGLVTHMRTAVFVKGVAAATELKSHCSSCPLYVSVMRNAPQPLLQNLVHVELSGLRLEMALLDCDHSYKDDDLATLIHHVIEHHKDHVFPAGSPLLRLAHLLDYMILLPHSNSCGLLARILPTGTQPIEVAMSIRGQRMEQLDTLPAGDSRLQVHVTRTPASSTSPYWDMAVLYGHSASLSKYKLTTEVTINNGHKMCVDVTAFIKPSDFVVSIFCPRSHSATVMLTSFSGHPTDGEHSSLQVTVHGQAAAAEWSAAWPYSACRRDLQEVRLWNSHCLPLTHACYEIVHEIATLRYYNISISSSNLPAWTDALLDLGPSRLVSALSSNITAHLAVPQESSPVLTVNGYKMVLGSSVNTRLQPLLINTQFSPVQRLLTHVRLVGSCVLTLHNVWTLDGANLTTDVPACYALAIADCSLQPQFALFIRKVEGTVLPLAVKMYAAGNQIEVLPTADQVAISVNNRTVTSPQEGYQYPSTGSNYVFRVWQQVDGLVRIHLQEAHVWLEYYGHLATVSVLGLYHGDLCGLCGDYNGDEGDDIAQVFTLTCPDGQ